MCTHAVLPRMLAQQRGRIVNLVSRAGLIGLPATAAYAAGKGGVFGFTNVAARDLLGSGITVNAVNPAATDTRMVAGAIEAFAAQGGAAAERAAGLRAALQPPHEIAPAIVRCALMRRRTSQGRSSTSRRDNSACSRRWLLRRARRAARVGAQTTRSPRSRSSHCIRWASCIGERAGRPRARPSIGPRLLTADLARAEGVAVPGGNNPGSEKASVDTPFDFAARRVRGTSVEPSPSALLPIHRADLGYGNFGPAEGCELTPCSSNGFARRTRRSAPILGIAPPFSNGAPIEDG